MSAKAARWRERLRKRFFIAQQGRCWLCGEPMDLHADRRTAKAATWYHVVPKSKGGGSTQDNLMLAHRWCNNHRADREDVRAMRYEVRA
jgi:5-methylcytosine-specific restriction endonuclease McrA